MQKYKDIFINYTGPFLQNASGNEKEDLQVKYDHSLNVFDNTRNICMSLSLDKEFAETVKIAGLFHDTGRFPQYLEFKTFKDSESCNHGTLGVRTILKEGLLKDLPSARRKIVLGAIALHNRKDLPPSLPSSLRLCTEIIRDADKTDIMKVLLSYMEDTRPGSTVPLMGLKEIPDMFSEPVILAVENKIQATYTDMRCINDFRLMLLSWAHDLNFKWSRQQMLTRGYVNRLFSQLPPVKRINDLYDPIIERLNS